MNTILSYLKNKRLVWQASHNDMHLDTSSTGYDELDAALEGGFPKQGVVDISSTTGIGELRLLLPNLLTRQASGDRLMVFIAPPMQLNSEFLLEQGFDLNQVLIIQPETEKHALWSAEQCLKSGSCHSVLLWQQKLATHHVKRLQLAAEQGDALHVMLRQNRQLSLSLPVSLAMRLNPHPQGLTVEITKRKGGWPAQPFTLSMRNKWPSLTLIKTANNVVAFPQTKVS